MKQATTVKLILDAYAEKGMALDKSLQQNLLDFEKEIILDAYENGFNDSITNPDVNSREQAKFFFNKNFIQ